MVGWIRVLYWFIKLQNLVKIMDLQKIVKVLILKGKLS